VNNGTPLGPPPPCRVATFADENALYDLLVDLHRNNEHGWGFPYRPEIVLSCIEAGTRPEPAARRNPSNQRRGIIGVIDGTDGRLIASVGLFIDPVVWFSDATGLTELWLYVRPWARHAARHYRSLFAFSLWAHDFMRSQLRDYPLDFPLSTGFLHLGHRLGPMERLWARFSGAKKAGVLFVRR
jgi:hypothetical protein